MKKLLTLVLVDDGSSLLLGIKKRGFGEGQWNGFGGKVEENETIIEAAKREVEEEVGLVLPDITQVAILTFSFASDETMVLEVHVFKATSFSGQPVETEEMRPQWFLYSDIPYDEMWPDDRFWLPKVLEGKAVIGSFHFDALSTLSHRARIFSYELKEVASFQDSVY